MRLYLSLNGIFLVYRGFMVGVLNFFILLN